MKPLLTFVLMLVSITIFSQDPYPCLLKCKPDDPRHGISKKMLFETILNTNMKQKELINSTKDIFINYRLLDPKKFRLDEISDSQVEFKLPFGYRQGLFYGKYTLGAGVVKPATYLFFDAIFSFNNTGQVKITITNFREKAFFPINKKGRMGIDTDIYGEFINPQMKDYSDAIYLESMSKSLIGKVLILTNGGYDNFSNIIEDINSTLDKQFEVIDKAASSGGGEWIDNAERIISLMNPKDFRVPIAEERTANGYLLVVDNQRWDEHFRMVLISTFIEITKKINGSIVGIAQDGKLLFENINGKVLPTDPKERKKWEKEGKSL